MNGAGNCDLPRKLMLVAVEPSGDSLGAALIEALSQSAISISGCGGPLMQAAGLNSLFPIDGLSVMGFTDVARALPEAYRRVRDLAEYAAAEKIDAVVFIDGWAFSRIGAEAMRKHAPGIKLFKYAAPQVWASRPQRKTFVKRYFDGVLTLLPFEEDIFQSISVPTRFVGNPTFQAAANAPINVSEFRKQHGLGGKPILAVLPGSRRGEVDRLLPVFEQTVDLLRKDIADLQVVIPAAPAVAALIGRLTSHWPNTHLFGPSEKYDAIASADVAMAASGTVTTEVAILATPQIIAYRVDWLTRLWAQFVVKTRYASILNVMADKAVIPEFIQENCQPTKMADTVKSLLTDPQSARAQLLSLNEPLVRLNPHAEPAASQAARAILGWL